MKQDKHDAAVARRRALMADRPANYALVAAFACALFTCLNVYAALYPSEFAREHRRNPVFLLLFLPLGWWFGGLKRFEPAALRGVYPFFLIAPLIGLAADVYVRRSGFPNPGFNDVAAALGILAAAVGAYFYRRSLLTTPAVRC